MEKKIHLIFSLVMSLFMIAIMSFVVTLINIGFVDNLITSWLKSFLIAWTIGFPIMFFFAPVIRRTILKNTKLSNKKYLT